MGTPTLKVGLAIFGAVMALGLLLGLWWPHIAAPDGSSSPYETYRVVWNARDGAAKMELALDPADRDNWIDVDRSIFSRPQDPDHLTLVATAPNTGRLASHAADCPPERLQRDECELGLASIVLFRDPRKLPSGRRVTEAAQAKELKVRESDGAWRLLGTDYAEQGLERWLPSIFGLAKTTLRTYEIEIERQHVYRAGENVRCLLVLLYRGRLLHIDTGRRCADRRPELALRAAFELLERAATDARRAPDDGSRLARLQIAVDNCGRVAASARQALLREFPRGPALEQAEYLCTYAIRLGRGLLPQAPAEASALMLEAMAWRVHDFRVMREFYDGIMEALAATGRRESRDGVLALTLRLHHIGGSTDQRDRAEFDRALDSLLALAPRLLAADDPLLDDAERAIAHAASPARVDRHLAFVRMWHQKAQASDPASEAATKARYRLCRVTLYAAVHRDADVVEGCALWLVAQWEAGIASGASFELYFNEAELAMLAARSLYIHGATAGDPASRAADLRRIADMAGKRFPRTREYDALHSRLGQMARDLAAKPRR